ncbi:hypothetical protein ACLIA0_00700 [Bacillaceae bacterium W0354]
MDSKIKRTITFSLSIAVITFVLAAIFSIVSQATLEGTSWIIGLFIVLLIIIIGVLFDMMGIAAAAASETPFHSMAARKVFGAKQAISIVRNADRFASFCNDVIGDISGIISGTATGIVVLQIALSANFTSPTIFKFIIATLLTSIVAALTVGGKALGKTFAITRSTEIILFAGKFAAFVENKLKIKIIPDIKKVKNSNNK